MHIPTRASDLPSEFKDLLEPGKIQTILCTGNVCSKEILQYLKTIAPDVRVVKGEYDKGIDKEYEVINFGQIKIGLIHGHQITPWGDKESLLSMQRKLDVDVLVSGHTHELSLYEYQNKIFLNPGSATGAFHPLRKTDPSFILMDVQGSQLDCYIYTLVKDKVECQKKKMTKK
jgi:vacuolar protein sorting-associated protein 29